MKRLLLTILFSVAFGVTSLGAVANDETGTTSSGAVVKTKAVKKDRDRAKGLIVTDVFLTDEDSATITLNNAIQIREIKVLKVGKNVTLKFPEYVSKRGRVYPQVEVVSKNVYDKILKAIKSGRPGGGKAKSVSFRVGEPFMLRSPVRRANVAVTFNDAIVITTGVMKSKRKNQKYWVGYPGRRPEKGGRYINQVVITSKKLKGVLEKAIIRKFERAKSELGEVEEY